LLYSFFQSVEQWSIAAQLRGSTWAYPLVNAAHIVGIALLFGAIVPLDLRLAGFWQGVPVAPLRRALVPMAVLGLCLAITAGTLLFIAKAPDYAASGLFQAKMAVVVLALINATALRLAPAWRAKDDTAGSIAGLWPQLAGIASIVLWLTAILLGRLVGYFKDYGFTSGE
jgi:hypothetical protein